MPPTTVPTISMMPPLRLKISGSRTPSVTAQADAGRGRPGAALKAKAWALAR